MYNKLPWNMYCVCYNNITLSTHTHTHTHTHTDPPKADDTISATPFNRTAILLGWSPPADFSRDPLLLRYTLFYTNDAPQFPLNSSTAESVPDLLPVLRNGRLEYVLSNLEIGTEYWISVRASYMELNGEESELFAFSPTYGHGRYILHDIVVVASSLVIQCHTYTAGRSICSLHDVVEKWACTLYMYM